MEFVACSRSDASNWFLIGGQRIREGKPEFILYDFRDGAYQNSVGQVLPKQPAGLQSSRDGGTVAVLYEDELSVYGRRVRQSDRPNELSSQLAVLIADSAFDDIQNVCDNISMQQCHGYRLSPGELNHQVIHDLALHWRTLELEHADSPERKHLQAWYRKGSPLALTVSGVRHYLAARDDRDGEIAAMKPPHRPRPGTDPNRLQLALADLDKAAAVDVPYLAAFYYRIISGISNRESMQEIEKLCQKATRLYPSNTKIPKAVCYRLTMDYDQAFRGEPGDALSLARATSAMIQSPYSDINYTRVIGNLAGYRALQSAANSSSMDTARLKRGIHEWKRQGIPSDGELLGVFYLLQQLAPGSRSAETLLTHIMGTQAAFSRTMRIANQIPGGRLITPYFTKRFEALKLRD
jgi:hypothetical protein